MFLQESPYEEIIVQNINETFLVHPYFKEVANLDFDSLCRICKAYAEYDEETGFCQVLSFLAASLLVHVCNIACLFKTIQILEIIKKLFFEITLIFSCSKMNLYILDLKIYEKFNR